MSMGHNSNGLYDFEFYFCSFDFNSFLLLNSNTQWYIQHPSSHPRKCFLPQHTKLFLFFLHLFQNIFSFFFHHLCKFNFPNSRFFVCIDFYCNFFQCYFFTVSLTLFLLLSLPLISIITMGIFSFFLLN